MKNKDNLTKTIIISTILLTTFFVCLSAANAVNVTLNSGDAGGVNSAVSTVADGSDVNNTITLNSGTYNKTTDRNNNITFNGKNLTIQGNISAGPAIIDARGQGRIFTISGNSNVTFINIIFINANITGSGGVIYNTNSGTKLTFINCVFENSTATSYGGVIYNAGNNFEVKNCTFTNNRASNGGAICSESSNFTVIDSIFTNNSANSGNYYGGAIYNVYSSNSTLINCTFTNNTAGWGGCYFLLFYK